MSKRTKKNQPQSLYMVSRKLYDDDSFSDAFAFHATDDKDAESKRFGWVRYHSLTNSFVAVRKITSEEIRHESWIHNEWVR